MGGSARAARKTNKLRGFYFMHVPQAGPPEVGHRPIEHVLRAGEAGGEGGQQRQHHHLRDRGCTGTRAWSLLGQHAWRGTSQSHGKRPETKGSGPTRLKMPLGQRLIPDGMV